MFFGALKFNADISQWNVENCRSMNGMFGDTRRFNQDISKWNTTNVKFMKLMFENAIAFQKDLSSWNLSNGLDVCPIDGFKDDVFFNSGVERLHIEQFYDNHRHKFYDNSLKYYQHEKEKKNFKLILSMDRTRKRRRTLS